MSKFKAGIAAAAASCAVAFIAGHGSVGAGFSRLGTDAKATAERFRPAAAKALGYVGSAMTRSSQDMLSGYMAMEGRLPQGDSASMAASASQAAQAAHSHAQQAMARAPKRAPPPASPNIGAKLAERRAAEEPSAPAQELGSPM